MQVSTAEKNFGSSDSPLARAIEWIEKQESAPNGPRYVLVATEKWLEREKRSYRSYRAVKRKLFLFQYVTGTNWHCHEILMPERPVRLYCDFEFHRTDTTNASVDGPALVRRFLDILLNTLGDEHGLDRMDMRVVLMDSSKASKFSQHVVVQLAPNDRVAFANSVACGQFVQRVVDKNRMWLELPNPNFPTIKPESFVDTSVYSPKHAFRMLGSSKVEEPKRILRLVGAENAKLTERQFEESLITVPLVPNTLIGCTAKLGKRQRTTNTFLRTSSSSRLRVSVTGRSTVDDLLDAMVELDSIERTSVKAIPERGEIQVETRSGDCAIAKRIHHHAKIFIILNLYTRRWRVGCHHGECWRTTMNWNAIPSNLAEQVDEVVKDVMQPEEIGMEEAAELLQ